MSEAAVQSAPATSNMVPMLPELLAPAGDWECARAAVENGADAIYFGLDRFNARMRAHNFTEADLPDLMAFLHRRGVRGYVTFNTLVFTAELPDAEQYLRAIIAAGVDAAIVQDVGICRLIRRISPDFPIHASTQMTITSAAGVEFARELGCNLAVLARECSIAEIEKMRMATDEDRRPKAESDADSSAFGLRPLSLPLEVFVHGALCVAYSGQCLTSEALGGRSANRGECAQACRMTYDLLSDGRQVDLGGRQYLLSPQDLAGLEVLPDLVKAGVSSLKIEGRLKAPEYVASITRVYRKALDRLRSDGVLESRVEGEGAGTPPLQNSITPPSPADRYEMEMAFSRGLYTGWFRGIQNQELVHARFGKKRGVYLGEVVEVNGDRVGLRLESELKPGDGVVFDAGKPSKEEEGGSVYYVDDRDGLSWLGFGPDAIDFRRVVPGNKLWKTSDPVLERQLRQTFEGEKIRFQRPITVEVHGAIDLPLTLILRDELGHVVQAASELKLAKAETQPLTTEKLTDQLGRLGGTPFRLGRLVNKLEGEVILPVSELNRLRRDTATRLDALRAEPKRWTMNAAEGAWSGILDRASGIESSGVPLDTSAATAEPELIVLVRSLVQLEAALTCGVQTVYCEFEDPKKYRQAVAMFHTARGCHASGIGGPESVPSIWVAPPRIFKAGEEWILEQVRSSNADGYLVRNHEHLRHFADCRCIGDFSLNVANPLTADYFMRRFGLERLTAAYDLNITQLEGLLQGAPPEWFEVTIHQHMPMFHMEHCVFCAFLSKGKDYSDCGRPCDKHEVKLRDRVGQEHVLKADAGCRNTLFNARAQTGAEGVERLLALGLRKFRIEFVSEGATEVSKTIAQYRKLLRGETSGAALWQELKLMNQLGVTRGSLEKS
jgi:putative protease